MAIAFSRFFVAAIFFVELTVCAGKTEKKVPPFMTGKSDRVEKILQSLSLDEKIAQLFMPAVSANGNKQSVDQCECLIRDNHIGGVFLGGKATVDQQVALVNCLQKISRIPLLIGQDLEWGPAMRLTDGMSWPKAVTLGAVTDNNLIYQTARVIADQARAIGVHVTASPDLDVNNNPLNPVINVRSFGSSPQNVERAGCAFARGLQEGNILACGKHFPGHGNTYTDSHLTLPVISGNKKELFAIECAPFKKLIDNGIPLIMIGHLAVPALDPTNTPATFSYPIVTELLKNKFEFDGMAMSDALNMAALPALDAVEINTRAITAGIDLLIYAQKVPETITAVKKLIKAGKISEQDITQRAYKVLRAKEYLGLFASAQIDPAGSKRARPNAHDNKLKKKLYEHAVTRVRDPHNAIPLDVSQDKHILIISSDPALDVFGKLFKKTACDCNRECRVDTLSLADCADKDSIGDKRDLKKPAFADASACVKTSADESARMYDSIIFALDTKPALSRGILHGEQEKTKISEDALRSHLARVSAINNKCVIVLFSSPYELAKLPSDVPVLLAYDADVYAQKAAAQAILGKKPIRGKLPVDIK